MIQSERVTAIDLQPNRCINMVQTKLIEAESNNKANVCFWMPHSWRNSKCPWMKYKSNLVSLFRIFEKYWIWAGHFYVPYGCFPSIRRWKFIHFLLSLNWVQIEGRLNKPKTYTFFMKFLINFSVGNFEFHFKCVSCFWQTTFVKKNIFSKKLCLESFLFHLKSSQ